MSQGRCSFFSGAACGAAAALAITLLLGNSKLGVAESSGSHLASPSSMVQQYEPGDYFVTGEGATATLWRRERDGTLTCISVNTCLRAAGQ